MHTQTKFGNFEIDRTVKLKKHILVGNVAQCGNKILECHRERRDKTCGVRLCNPPERK